MRSPPTKIVIAGGGTGGHLFPAVALGEEIMRERPGVEVLFVGTRAGMEARWLPASGYKFELFDVHGVRGHGVAARIRASFEFVRAIAMARRLIARERPCVVVGAGGYASAPIAAAAILARIPLILMEQNTRLGLANRLFRRFARRICVGFEDTKTLINSPEVAVTGNPVRFKCRPEPRVADASQIQILVLGGSSGAHRLNLGVRDAFKNCGKSVIKMTVVHQTGDADESKVRQAYENLGLSVRVIPFIDAMSNALADADLIIARSGAMTVTEIAMAARAAIFVPYPFHKDMQQLHNARVLERCGGAIIVNDDEDLGRNLAREIERMCTDREELIAMGRRAHLAARPNAARDIAAICFEYADRDGAVA